MKLKINLYLLHLCLVGKVCFIHISSIIRYFYIADFDSMSKMTESPPPPRINKFVQGKIGCGHPQYNKQLQSRLKRVIAIEFHWSR